MAWTVRLLALLTAASVGGCGAGGGSTRTDRPAAASAAVPVAPRQDARPALHAPRLLEIERLGNQMGTSDRVAYGVDGEAVMIKAYGGGGFYAWRCRLTASQLRSLRRAVAALPLGPAPPHPPRKRASYYQPPPASFIVRTKGYSGSFLADAQPRNARPLVAHLVRILYGKEGHCRQTFGTRVH